MIKNEFVSPLFNCIKQMDPPATRREKKKDQKEKGSGKDGKYSQKHIRAVQELKDKKKTK